jgi:hypothetical protein
VWRDYQWAVIVGLWLGALMLGYVGFAKHFAALNTPRSFGYLFYVTLQLFILESGAVAGPMSWELEVARLLAPAVALVAAANVLLVLLRERLPFLWVRGYTGHVVICGLGRKGMVLAHGFLARGERVVVIEQDEGNDFIATCQEQGAIVLLGNAATLDMLRKAGVHKARCVLAVCGDDGANAAAAVYARDLVKGRQGQVLTCLVHLVDPHLCNLLREQELAAPHEAVFRLEFFNIFESGAWALLDQYPAFDDTEMLPGRPPHLVVVGVGRLGESLVIRATHQWKAQGYPKTNQRLRLTLIDQVADQKTASLLLRYQHLDTFCDLVAFPMDITSPTFERAAFLGDETGACPVSRVYICLDHDGLGLSAALALHHRLREHTCPIVVRMTHEAGLATLLPTNRSGKGYDGLSAFGLLDRTCTPALLVSGTFETLARAGHAAYVRQMTEARETPQTRPHMGPWEALPDDIKEDNRSAAGDIGRKLQAVGCSIRSSTDLDPPLFRFQPAEIEVLARMEHERWYHAKRAQGWAYAPGKQDRDKKTHPALLPWDELPEADQEIDRQAMRDLPALLASVGFEIDRLPG